MNKLQAGGRHDMHHPDLQVVARYTSCMHMDRSPYTVCQCCPASTINQNSVVTLTFDLLTLKGVTCDVGYLCANFSLSRPLCSRVWPDVRDRQTDPHRQTSDKSIA